VISVNPVHGLLSRVARLLVRGPDAPFVLGDLDETLRRDLDQGMPSWRAGARYASGRRVRPRARHPDEPLAVHMLNVFETPLPFHEGERVVGLRHSETVMESGNGTLHAYAVWRETLSSFEEIGSALRADFNVVPDDGAVRPWFGAFMTASSFRIARVPPLLGRPLLDQDELVGAPDVVVLGYEPWQVHFVGDPGAVGRTLRIAGTRHTVVGVMPEGFRFPSNEHLWIPLRGSASAEAGTGPEIWIYGRLADGVTESQALAELTGVEAGLDEAFPEAYGDVRPEIVRYSYLPVGGPAGTRWILAPPRRTEAEGHLAPP